MPVATSLNSIMLYKHAAHLHAARLYIDFELSKDADELYKYVDVISSRKVVFTSRTYNPKSIKKYFGPSTLQQYMKWNKIFGEVFLKK